MKLAKISFWNLHRAASDSVGAGLVDRGQVPLPARDLPASLDAGGGLRSELVMRGRYLSLRLTVDGCQSTLPSALRATFPRNSDGTTKPTGFTVAQVEFPITFRANLKVEKGKLLAIRIPEADLKSKGVNVSAMPGSTCDALRIDEPVDFYIAEHAADPTPLKTGQELWIEVTVPPQGPPRPIQLALKQDGAWKPLAFQ